MKSAAVFTLLVTATSAFTAPSMTFAVGKKSAAKPAAKTAGTKVVKAAAKAPVKAKVAPKVVAKKAPVKAAATKPVVAKKAYVSPFAKKAAAAAAKGGAKVAPKAAAKPAPKVAPKVVAKKVAPKVVAKKVAPKAAAKKVAPKKIVVKKTFAKKPIKKSAPVFKSSNYKGGVVPSTAIPGELAPDLLDGSMVGDVGFDPCFLSTKADTVAPYFNNLFAGSAPVDGLTWYREAELMHGRICMIAAVGFIVPGFVTFSGNDWTGVDAYKLTNPLEAAGGAPGLALVQIFAFMGFLEFKRINYITEKGTDYMAGDSQAWGQGDGRWNPFNFDYTPEEYAKKQLQEVKHARLAMVGLLGLIFQANASGVGVVEQWSGALVLPGYVGKAGYFFPDGI